MMMRRVFLILILFSLTSMTCSCPVGDLLPFSGKSLSFEERNAVFEDLSAYFDTLDQVDPDEDRQAMAEHIRQRSEIGDAGVAEDGSVWGRFVDGRIIIYTPDLFSPTESITEIRSTSGGGLLMRVEEPSTVIGKPVVESQASTSLDTLNFTDFDAPIFQTSLVGDLPQSHRALTLTTLDPDPKAFGAEEWIILDLLSEKKYLVDSFPPTVDALRQGVRGVGVLYFNTHGGMGLTNDDEYLYALETKTPVSSENDDRYEDDLDDHRLVYLGGWESYGITGRFVSEYMSFSEDSFVMIASCGSFKPAMLSGFREAGVSVYSGWSNITSCWYNAALTTFDILLGTNKVVDETPPIRPFDYMQAWDYLKEKKLDSCGNAQLMFQNLSGDFGLLAPTIKKMQVDEIDEELILNGIFGSEEGRVTINGSAVSVKSWESSEIRVELPGGKAANGAGDVVVSVRDHKSNAVPLTRWPFKIHYEVDLSKAYEPDLKQVVDYEMYVRADVHSYREKPSGDPIEPEEVIFAISKDSKATFEFSGAGDPKPGVTFSLEGSGEMSVFEYPGDPIEQAHVFNFWGSINVQEQVFLGDLSGDMGGTPGGDLTTIARDGRMVILYEDTSPINLIVLDILMSQIRLEMDGEFNILGEKLEGSQALGQIRGFLEWKDIKAEYPPKENTHADLELKIVFKEVLSRMFE